MAQLRVPPDEQVALVKLQNLSEPIASKLVEAIGSAAAKTKTDGLRVEDLPEIPSLPRTEVEQILDTVLSLYRVRAYSDVSLDEFVVDVCDSMRVSERKDFSRTSEAIEHFKGRLAQFLGLEDVNRAAKSTVLRYEQERSVHSLKFLTDARPVFGNDVTKSPEAAVILHTLKIGYHHAGRIGEAFFAFDENDLEELKKAIQRAESKASSLRTALARAQLKVFDLS